MSYAALKGRSSMGDAHICEFFRSLWCRHPEVSKPLTAEGAKVIKENQIGIVRFGVLVDENALDIL
jgi:hypothetical protein